MSEYKIMDSDIEFQSFINKFWPLPLSNNLLPLENIEKIKRVIWYCNISGKIIPELQKYN